MDFSDPPPRVLSTIHTDEPDPEWHDRVTQIPYHGGSVLRYAIQVARMARRFDSLIILGSVGFSDRYRDLLVGVLVRRVTARHVHMVIADCTWSAGSRRLEQKMGIFAHLSEVAQRALVRLLANDKTLFCVLTIWEKSRFPKHWGVAPDRVSLTPFCHTLYDYEALEPRRGSYVFAGGDSLRDYRLLIDAVRDTELEVLIATRLTIPDVPPNVTVKAMTHQQYVDALLGARIVAVPLAPDPYRSAGQQTYLNAMLLRKVTIVTDSPGVREVVTNSVDAVVVEPEVAALREALRYYGIKAGEEELDEMGDRARTTVLKGYTPAHYRHKLLKLATDADEERRP